MKKKSVFYLLFFSIILFVNIDVCYADDNIYRFSASKDTNSVIMNAMCINSEVDSCSYICKNGESNGDPAYCNGLGDSIKEFYILHASTETELERLKVKLKDHTCKGSDDCYSWVKKNYCNNWNSTDKLCAGLKSLDGKSTTGNFGNSKDCYVDTQLRGSDDILRVTASYFSSENKIVFSSSINDSTLTFDGDQYYGKGNKFYLYSKGSNFSSFEAGLIEKFKSNNFSCNNFFTFCCDEKEDGYYVWYAEYGNTCPADKYTGVCQQTIGDGNTGITVREETKYGQELFGDATDILSCDALLSGDGDSTSLSDVLKMLVTLIKILVPIILLVLGTLDFAQAIFAQDEGAIKKAQGKFIKRLIIAVVIFLIPSALKLILTTAHAIWPVVSEDFCGIL